MVTPRDPDDLGFLVTQPASHVYPGNDRRASGPAYSLLSSNRSASCAKAAVSCLSRVMVSILSCTIALSPCAAKKGLHRWRGNRFADRRFELIHPLLGQTLGRQDQAPERRFGPWRAKLRDGRRFRQKIEAVI